MATGTLRRQRFGWALAVCGLLLGSAAAKAQAPQHDMGRMAMPAPQGGGAATEGYRAAMARMHHDMDIPYSGNADRDFVAGMIPHHQGAVDMAEVELRYGKDPALRRLARDIIAAQKKEIAFMKQWQSRHAH